MNRFLKKLIIAWIAEATTWVKKFCMTGGGVTMLLEVIAVVSCMLVDVCGNVVIVCIAELVAWACWVLIVIVELVTRFSVVVVCCTDVVVWFTDVVVSIVELVTVLVFICAVVDVVVCWTLVIVIVLPILVVVVVVVVLFVVVDVASGTTGKLKVEADTALFERW